jgi:hypothetical protein
LGTLTIFLVYRIAELLFSEKVAIFSSLLFAFNYAAISLARMATFHGLNIFFCCLSFYLGLCLLKGKNSKGLLVLYTTILIAMGYVNYFSMAFALFQLLLFMVFSKYYDRRTKKYFYSIFALTLSAFLFWVPIILRQYQNLKTHDYDRSQGENAIFQLLSYLFNLQNSFLIVVSLVVLLRMISKKSYDFKRDRNIDFLLLFSAISIPILVSTVYNQVGQPLWKNHYFGFLAPFFCILTSQAFEELSFSRLKRLPVLVYILVSSLSFKSIYTSHFPIVVDIRSLISSVVIEDKKSDRNCAYLNHSWNRINFDYYLRKHRENVIYFINNGELAKLNSDSGIEELDLRIKSSNVQCFWLLNTYNKVSPLLESYLKVNYSEGQTVTFKKAYATLFLSK